MPPCVRRNSAIPGDGDVEIARGEHLKGIVVLLRFPHVEFDPDIAVVAAFVRDEERHVVGVEKPFQPESNGVHTHASV